MPQEGLWVAILIIGILLALACEPRMALLFLLGGATSLLAAQCGLLPGALLPPPPGGASAEEGFSAARLPKQASYAAWGSQQIPIVRAHTQETPAATPPLAPPPAAAAEAPYPGDVDLAEPDEGRKGWWADDGALPRDGDEKAAGQARWRNDPLRPTEGILRRRRDVDPFLRGELDEDGERDWWGRHET